MTAGAPRGKEQEQMNALVSMVSEHPITSIWLALTFCVWFFIYAATRAQDEPERRRRG